MNVVLSSHGNGYSADFMTIPREIYYDHVGTHTRRLMTGAASITHRRPVRGSPGIKNLGLHLMQTNLPQRVLSDSHFVKLETCWKDLHVSISFHVYKFG